MPQTILVTGGNKGIGQEAVRLLSSKLPDSTILLATRSEQNGLDAIEKMRESGPVDNVHVISLDISSQSSIDQAVETVKSKYGQLDTLINNSGIMSADGDNDSPEVLDVNVRGTRNCTEAFIPLIKENGSIIIVSSEVGAWYMDSLPSSTRELLDRPADSKTIDGWIDDWVEFARKKSSKIDWTPIEGRMTHAYSVSKAILTSWARSYASNTKLKLAIVCPGYCATDLNGNSGFRPASKGGESITWPVFNEFETGKFYQDGEKLPFSYPMPEHFNS